MWNWHHVDLNPCKMMPVTHLDISAGQVKMDKQAVGASRTPIKMMLVTHMDISASRVKMDKQAVGASLR